MHSCRTTVEVGKPIVTERGTALVIAILRDCLQVRDVYGETHHLPMADQSILRNIDGGGVVALSKPMRPLWDGLDQHVRDDALDKLEIVQEILTGFRYGHRELRRAGEPFTPFGPGYGVSQSAQCRAMAQLLSLDAAARRRGSGKGPSSAVGASWTTVRNWVTRWSEMGLLGLIDGRSLRPSQSWDLIDPRYRAMAERVFDTLDGDISDVSNREMDRRIRLQLKATGVEELKTPQRITGQFLAKLRRQRGSTTRSQRTHALHASSGTRSYPAVRPGQVVAIDATRADNLVYDPLSGKPISVEIITAICVTTRVILALRVVARSANAVEAGLLIYDVCRPFSMTVEGADTSPWRWGGLPDQLDLTSVSLRVGRRNVARDLTTVQGEHHIPSVMPDAVHTDQGRIFLATHFFGVLHDFGISLLLSRGKKPTDNPHVERWHETIQRALQQIPGYKGRNTTQRGRFVAGEPLLSAGELQDHLRRFIALDYHRSPHSGIVLTGSPDDQGARLSPLEAWDAIVQVTGRIDVPQQPDFIYQFLPVRWGTIGHAGVEFTDMVYDSELLDNYRDIPAGTFRSSDRSAPFFVDPRDLSRIWFRDPNTNIVNPIPWRGAYRAKAPMADMILAAVRRGISARGGNAVLTRRSATDQILNELSQLTTTPSLDMRAKLAAAALRVEQSRNDHGESLEAQQPTAPRQPVTATDAQALRRRWPNLIDEDAR
jgi:transposase InsO family protein